ncbi:GNAT family N-acetyltransferase [Myxococcota bacterium]|nr:GNAT family N-acetyltransferase [Myxococcota bacterium]
MRALDATAWDALVAAPGEERSPFLAHAFLASLEDAGTLGPKAGWIPQLVAVHRVDDRGARTLVAAAPAYVKLHSQGEFVFDFAIADAAQRAGLRYYPKLLVAVPFTPVTGARLLTHPTEDRAALVAVLARSLVTLAKELECSSVHVNFAREDEVAALAEAGFEERHGIQYHWFRRGAATYDDYLARFVSKRRNQLRRERREMADAKITIDTLRGERLAEKGIAKLAFELYKSTVDKFYWGRQYLDLRFFELATKRCQGTMELVLAKSADGEPLGGAINFASDRRLYGRYWGAREDVKFLHFNVCYYRGIEETITRGLDVFEPGAGGEHKLVRGFEPTITRSAHWFADPRFHDAIASFLARERAAIAREREVMLADVGHKEHAEPTD